MTKIITLNYSLKFKDEIEVESLSNNNILKMTLEEIIQEILHHWRYKKTVQGRF